ncbi:MAG: TonB-dependent receptor, partial [Deltaproteobacteria bacterium]
LIWLLLFCLVCLSSINPVLAQEEFEEEALFRFEEYVVSASKRLQRIEEAPATITVITAEDIRQSGLTNIPEILRRVAGLDVVTLTAFDTQVAIRGFCSRTVNMNVFNKILVLVNGRSVYEDFFGGTIWEILPIQLEDIERIEVVKGPGSVLYGANALTGVINIITKSPDESSGGLASFTGGQFNHYVGSLIYDGNVRDLGYRLSGGWERASRLEERDRDSEEVGRFFGIFNYKINESSEVSLEGGISDGEGEIFVNFPGFLTDFQEGYVKADYNYSDFKVQAFWRGGKFIDMSLSGFLCTSGIISLPELLPPDVVIRGKLVGEDMTGRYDTYDMELQKSIQFAEIHTILGGLNYRFFTLGSNYTEQEGLNTYAGFFQYEIKPIPSVILNLGIRVDHQDYIGTNYSPRGSLIFTPVKDHTVFFSAGNAFRNPAYIDLFADVSLDLLVASTEDEYNKFLTIEVGGNENIKPERITSIDIGYRAILFEKLRANLEFFRYKIKDIIHTFGYFPESPPFIVMSVNEGEAKGIGGVVGLEYKMTPWLSGLINYSYQEITDQNDDLITSNPKHKINGGLRASLQNGLSTNILIHYLDSTEKEYAVPDLLPPTFYSKSLDYYIILTARVSYKFLNEHFEVTVSGQNLLNDEHREVPEGNLIPLRVFGNLSVRF